MAHIHLKPELIERIDRLAIAERRSRANMIAVLVEEALKARKQ